MTFLIVVMIAFLLLEISNVFVLFFTPDSKQAHGMGMFPAWEKSKSDPDVYNLMRYLSIWVAGSKLILIALLIVILVWGGKQLTMRRIDERSQVDPKGFSLRLGFTITALILALLVGSILAVLGGG